MIPAEVLNPREHWTPVATRDEAESIATACNASDDVGRYYVEPKGAAFAVAYDDESGAFVAYL
ncbi:hypothetical protein HOT99_gp092 [Caulobacter phage CcrBL10]|uniref:Uncharacterized protein n=1 Tax=Caulobacter phage CcrBL10 TaxID=2283269 RepID=A0A385EC02_9CAUD|nr:hypothetical protein HOT99_gp003 [Caulobacter phage CcrBL10]YP_009809155.1 hypothetical protein HOT99_gp092 [Caulobacter phage CcrBL10]AXQ68207.1 hypothetical protein CcrBL10_gp003 [Caulobacter phage CcrBL10]AXQ68525.1 hypothetical protein CcrBL10_gp321 [Caulobacter phage CcrBL10]